MAKKEYDFEIIRSLDSTAQRRAVEELAKTANRRLRRLRESGTHSYAADNAEQYLQELGLKYFPKTMKSDFRLSRELSVLQNFLSAKTSTLGGIREIQKSRIEQFKQKGLEIKDEQKFYQFLSSAQFKQLSQYADSNQVIEDFDSALSQGFTYDEIQEQYQEFLNSNMTFEQIEERRRLLNDTGSLIR